MRSLKTISYFSEDADLKRRHKSLIEKPGRTKFTESALRSMRAFLRHLSEGNWEKSVKYLIKLSKTNLFLTAIARGGFVINDTAKCSNKEIINRIIEQINTRNKIRWLKDISYHNYVNQVSNALYKEFRCDSVAAYFIIKNNRLKINRGWVRGWQPKETAKQMRK